MKCKIHNQPLTMVCTSCGDLMCPACAEFINGAWFCPKCAVAERKFVAGIRYRDIMTPGSSGILTEENPGEPEGEVA